MTQILKTWIVVFLVGLLSCGANAQDTYNFYFQKSGKKKEKEEPKAPEVVGEEFVEEVMEVDDDVLLVPDNWKPSQKRYKKVYVRKARPVTEIVEKVEKPKKAKDPHRGWEAKLGIGQISIDNYRGYGIGEITQKTYVLGTAYHMSKYFQVNMELHLPNGNSEYQSFGFNNESSLEPQGTIGLGATPIHLNVFGGEFLQIGIDGGVSFGNRDNMVNGTGRVYLGPRVAMNFSRHFSLQYAYKANFNSESDFDMSSLSMAYRW